MSIEENQTTKFISLAEASKISGYHQDYLGYLARIGKLEAQKIARNWVTTAVALKKLDQIGKTSEPQMTDVVKPIINTNTLPVVSEKKSTVIPKLIPVESFQSPHSSIREHHTQSGIGVHAQSVHSSQKKDSIPNLFSEKKTSYAEKPKFSHDRKYSDVHRKFEHAKSESVSETQAQHFGHSAYHGALSVKHNPQHPQEHERKMMDGLRKALRADFSEYIDLNLERKIEEKFKQKFRASQVSFDTYIPEPKPINNFSGLDHSLKTPALNLDKIHESFKHTAKLQKYLVANMVLMVTLLVGGVFFTLNANGFQPESLLKNIPHVAFHMPSLTNSVANASTVPIVEPVTASTESVNQSLIPVGSETPSESITQSPSSDTPATTYFQNDSGQYLMNAGNTQDAPQNTTPVNNSKDTSGQNLFSGLVSDPSN